MKDTNPFDLKVLEDQPKEYLDTDEFIKYLNNKDNAMFFSKSETDKSYTESTGYPSEISISWKNFRENVSFSYPTIEMGTEPSFMTIYSNKG